MKTNLKALQPEEIIALVENLGQSRYRAKQIINWLYKKHAAAFTDMTDLSRSFRDILDKKTFISNLKLLKTQVSKDGVQKFLFELEDSEKIESVLIPGKNRLTLCISSQAGCAMGCKFCTTGKLGLRRNLKAYEITDQVTSVQRLIKNKSFRDQKITNIVFMGMGEPMHNLTEVIEAISRIVNYIGLSQRKITVSTAGIIPKLLQFSQKVSKVGLAISLNATTEAVRTKIMPINKKYPLKELLNVCRHIPLPPRRRITFEYVLLEGINDSENDARRLVKLLKGIKSKVNLIPYNEIPSITQNKLLKSCPNVHRQNKKSTEYRKSSEERILDFHKIILDAGITVITRKSLGGDISAACGQLGTE